MRSYWLRKNFLLKCLKGLTSEQLSVINVFTSSKRCLNSAWHYYYPIFPWIYDKLSWRKSVFVRSEILGPFVNILTAENKYSRCNMHTLPQEFQTALSLLQKAFPWFFSAFLRSTWYLEHFQKKRQSPSLNVSESISLKRSGYLSV